ncbi:MAG: preprotein translocase subunit YajC [Chitinophagaceae bacterium]|nr:preprotein translocase subunit YajC [Chitinophagaceae bacterium]MBK8953293.1 preprotein translocase subunit YajC [Chitinophagaceae bacterium]
MKLTRTFSIVIAATIFLTSCVPPGGDSKSSGGGFTTLLFPILILVVFWLFFIRPQSKKAKEQKKFIENMGKGEKIVTIAGIHGTINKINEDGTIMLEVSPGSYIKIEKSAVSMEWTAQLNKIVPEKK